MFLEVTNVISTPNPSLFPCPEGFISYYYGCYLHVRGENSLSWAEAET